MWNFCSFLRNAGGVVAIPKLGVGHLSEHFEQIKSKAIKVTIIGIMVHYVIPFLKRVKIFESHCSFKFGLISALFYLTLYGECFR